MRDNIKMKIIEMTFGGLSAKYYFRNLFFAIAFGVTALCVALLVNAEYFTYKYIYTVISILLYPYSRFAYEKAISFIVVSNVFWVDTFTLGVTKIVSISLCLVMAIPLSTIGLFLIYLHHRKSLS